MNRAVRIGREIHVCQLKEVYTMRCAKTSLRHSLLNLYDNGQQ